MCLKKQLFLTSQYLLPQHLLSRILGKIAESKNQKLKTWLIKRCIKHFQIDLTEAAEPNADNYASFNDFFTRALAKGKRPISRAKGSIVSPADGAISQLGDIKSGRIFQAKGHEFSTLELLGGATDHAKKFKHGKFATIYLAPKDYHRVHMPITGTLTDMVHIPGKLFSVNKTTAENVPNLFARNERVACFFDTAIGPVAVVFVGAFFVASIETVWAGVVTPPTQNHITHIDYRDKTEKFSFKKGDELGRFKFGSTVVMLLPKDTMNWDKDLSADSVVKMGQKLGIKKA